MHVVEGDVWKDTWIAYSWWLSEDITKQATESVSSHLCSDEKEKTSFDVHFLP